MNCLPTKVEFNSMDMPNIDFEGLAKKAATVLDPQISKTDYCAIDLSVSNDAIQNVDASSSDNWELFIDGYLNERNKKVAFGGYLERRNLYQRSAYFANQKEERNIHLGVDLWAPEGTSVHALLDGKIHSFQNNQNHGDYGPTILLEHIIGETKLYSLYGHLSVDSLSGIHEGARISAGDRIGWLGDASVNGDYAPHLHFQLMLDLENNWGDYPGVCSEAKLEWYAQNCPNPLLLLGL